MPHPSIMLGFEQVIPGSADRLLRMAEAQSKHEQEMEAKALTSDIADRKDARIEARIGQSFGLLIALAFLATAAHLAVNGAQLAGGIIGATGLTGLVSVFVAGRMHQAKASEKKPD